MSHLTDDIGPRLTGSPNMKKANEWTRDEFTKWGLANAHLEPWGPFGRGWAYQLCEVRMTSPDYMQFLALPEAWTPGTNGPLRGEVTRRDCLHRRRPGKVSRQAGGQDRVVWRGPHAGAERQAAFQPRDERRLGQDRPIRAIRPARQAESGRVKRYQFQADVIKFFTDEHVAAVLDITREPGEDGDIQVQAGGPYEKGKTIDFPRVTLSVEHFGRVARLLERTFRWKWK